MFLLGSGTLPTLQLLLPQPRGSRLARELGQKDRHEQASLTGPSTWSAPGAKIYRGLGKTAEGRRGGCVGRIYQFKAQHMEAFINK